MPSQPAGRDQQWLIVAIPGAVVAVLLGAFLLIYSLRTKSKPADQSAPVIARSDASIKAPTPAPPPAPSKPPPAPPAVASTPATSSAPPSATPANTLVSSTPTTPPPAALTETAPTAPPTPPAPAAAPSEPKNLLSLVNLPGDAVAGNWQMENGQLKCTDGNIKNHARIRLIPPPDGDYDFSVTFTTGPKPNVGQILTYKGKQFIFLHFVRDSGFAIVGGKNAHTNASTVPHGIRANTKYTSVIKVRADGLTATLNGEPLTTLTTDYSNLTLPDIWEVGAAKPLGILAQCPMTIEAITLTPIAPGEESTTEAPVAAAPATPTPASAYKQLARIITNSYSAQSSAGATQPAGATATIPTDLQAVVATSQPVISDVAASIIRGHSAASQPADDALFHAVEIATGRDPSAPDLHPDDPLLQHADNDEQPLLVGNPRLFAGLKPATPPTNADRAAFDLAQTRLAAWQTLTDQFDKIYPKAEPSTGVIKFEVLPNGSFFATNASAAVLKDATLLVEIVNIATSPSVSTRQYYFIPTWTPGHKIYMPAMPAPNVASPELLAMTAPAASWSVTSAVEIHAQLWSDKVSQPLETTRLDARLEAIARAQLAEAFGTLGEYLRRPPGARAAASSTARPNALFPPPIILPKVTLADTTPAIVQAKAAAKRVLSIMPAGSPLAADANALLSDPQTALRDLRKRQLDEFLAALPNQKFRTGVWTVHRPGALARLSTPNGRESIARANHTTAGRMTLTIDTRGPTGEVTATLANPEQPTLKRKMAGRLQVDGSANRLLLQLRAPPNTTRPPTEADYKLAAAWTRLLLELHDTQLRGIAEVGAGDNAVTLDIAFDEPRDVPKPPAK